MNKKLYILFFLLFMIHVAYSQQDNVTYSFLNTTNSARVAALGGIMLPIDDSDIQLTTFNPSLINPEINNAISLSYVDYYNDIKFGTVQYAHTFDKIGTFVGGIQYNNYGDLLYADESGNHDGTMFSASDYAINIGWGRQLNQQLSIGANIKFAGIQYEQNSSFAIAVDVAAMYKTKSDWTLSVVARNIGYELYNNYLPYRNKLPFVMQAGVSKTLEHLPLTVIVLYDNIQKWDLSYDDPLDLEGNYDPMTGEYMERSKMDKFAKNLFSHFVFAGELNLGKNLSLRAGYNYGLRQEMKSPARKGAVGFSYGVAVKIYKFNISYSRSEMHITGSPNYITITTNLDSFKKH